MMRIFLIDDDPNVTENLAEYLREEHRIKVLNYVLNEVHLHRSFDDFHPDGAILDYDMASNGVAIYGWIASWQVKQPKPSSVRTVFYTKYANSLWHRAEMLKAGAQESQIVSKVEAADDVARLLEVLQKLR